MPDPADERPAQLSPVPFVAALVIFLVVAVLAYVFLREDRQGRLMAPDRIVVVDDDTIEVSVDAPFRKPYAEIRQVGYAFGDDRLFVELVVHEYDCSDDGDCGAPDEFISAVVDLPRPLEGRDVVVGTGRQLLDCERTAARMTCG